MVEKFVFFQFPFFHDSGEKFQISFEPTFLSKRPWFCSLMMMFSQKEAI